MGRHLLHKQSSAEHKEQTDAINSMYEWYGASVVCYAYLADVVDVNDEYELKQSQWFQRGWTLQEMLASRGAYILFTRLEDQCG